MSACEELAASPHHHVSRSQTSAPSSAAATSVDVTTSGRSTPLAIVAGDVETEEQEGDEVEERRPGTASCGVSTRVDTTVAIELAAS